MLRSKPTLFELLQLLAELGQYEKPSRHMLETAIAPSLSENLYKLCDEQALNDITLDSRQASKNSIFVAIKGSALDGQAFIEDAITRGSFCVLLDATSYELGKAAPLFECKQINNKAYICCYVSDLATHFPYLIKCIFDTEDFPNITAITGTNGKTSVANLCAQLASLCGVKAGSIGTLGVSHYDLGKSTLMSETLNTTPDLFTLCRHLQSATNKGLGFVALEASSHGLAQKRLRSIRTNCGIFTNLTQDHLDYHENMQAYAAAKRRLMSQEGLQYLVLNADDDESKNWADISAQNIQLAWYSMSTLAKGQKGSYVSDCQYTQDGCEISLHTHWGNAQLVLPLLGDFNVANYLSSLTALCLQGFAFDKLIAATKKLQGIVGRMELFPNSHASIIVDYAHTPDALKQALKSARRHTRGELHVVFGCGGNRDKSKRSLMGAIAQSEADNIVLTQDNSRMESPVDIIADIKKGIDQQTKVAVVLDRKSAIKHAWQSAKQEDIVVLAGKGHEDYLEINNQRIDYNEREYVKTLTAVESEL
ncbi:UDP-N-acetylmuramoyl-L-alanyl-D-glutamate--2,6-diaminopimelate ligase [Glaciecola petra]|uniref:UDP-N-acetylmuramyl-tripeptide synthetase n=1 Tax=Glaciecola petra TaxID=3075602 RepID=A0ABU2ZPH1_9ALTE|nr:UDP-N-acetylmuramoyl-L-alanyl-D-glutamate--2,6-diaminopimelate ligase [Aestuariibacter sp. P117]MDT0593494.1 UDP-N-acetylmuramoyl-L-alanyl-D-glutamate--2,6-diaminopimelate ligase [Aestuariibacter sp. P117]